MNHELAELYGEASILIVVKAWQDMLTGACDEDAGLIPHQESVRQRSTVRHQVHGSTANSMAGSSEVRSVGGRVSKWMGGYSQ